MFFYILKVYSKQWLRPRLYGVPAKVDNKILPCYLSIYSTYFCGNLGCSVQMFREQLLLFYFISQIMEIFWYILRKLWNDGYDRINYFCISYLRRTNIINLPNGLFLSECSQSLDCYCFTWDLLYQKYFAHDVKTVVQIFLQSLPEKWVQ